MNVFIYSVIYILLRILCKCFFNNKTIKIQNLYIKNNSQIIKINSRSHSIQETEDFYEISDPWI